ncbi:MAG: universal stress protein [Candidatus Eremiobacteraeota bacterium]|nr:universal stress protein [Candidatus Eremiobacteraeota bacterium]MBC5827026.1 universal stress protein [Candidatus Eremiobacteraeota bacterium]
MNVTLCVDLRDGLRPVAATIRFVSLAGADVEIVHVREAAARTDLEHALRPGLVRPRLRETEVALRADEDSRMEEIYRRARALLRAAGCGTVALSLLDGQASQAIVRHIAQRGTDLCVIGRRPDWDEASELGPRSVGKTARYIIDHANCPVLVLR